MKMREALKIAMERLGETPEQIAERFACADSAIVSPDPEIKPGLEEESIQFHMRMASLSNTKEGRKALEEYRQPAMEWVRKNNLNQ